MVRKVLASPVFWAACVAALGNVAIFKGDGLGGF